MGIKQIFKDGLRDLKRRSNLRQAKNKLAASERQQLKQLQELGSKAWQMHAPGTESGLASQLQADEQGLAQLAQELAAAQKSLQQTEETRKNENSAFESRRKESETKKSKIDAEIKHEKDLLHTTNSEIGALEKKLKTIATEEHKLQQNPSTTSPLLAQKREQWAHDRTDAQQRIDVLQASVRQAPAEWAPLEAEAATLQTEINRIRTEQKTAISQLDQTINQQKSTLNDIKKKQLAKQHEQGEHYVALGRHIFAQPAPSSGLEKEIDALRAIEADQTKFNAEITQLEADAQTIAKGALGQMIAIIICGILIMVAAIMAIVELTKPKQPNFLYPNLGTSNATDTLPYKTQQPCPLDKAIAG